MPNAERDFAYRDGHFEFDCIGRDCAHAVSVTVEEITIEAYFERDLERHRRPS